MKVLAFINQKGGVGKTTCADNVAFGLATIWMKKVLVIDLDPQANTSRTFGNPFEHLNHVTDLFEKPFIETRAVIRHVEMANADGWHTENLGLIPSNIRLALVAEQLTSKVHREKILDRKLAPLDEKYDYVILDCPPNLGLLTINAIYAATHFIIPVNYGIYALEGMNDLMNVINEVKEKHWHAYSILRNNFDMRNSQTNLFIDNQLEHHKHYLLDTKIRKCEGINQAQINREVIFTFDQKSNASADFKSLCEEIHDEI